MLLIMCTKFQINRIILTLFSGVWDKNPTPVAEKVVKKNAVGNRVKKYAGLKSYFLSEEFVDARFQRLQKAFENPLTSVVLFFRYQAYRSLQASTCYCNQMSH